MKEIRYKVEAMSRGRNGYFNTSGVALLTYGTVEPIVEIAAFTGKGVQSESILLRIPKDKAAEVGQALIDLSKEK